VRPEPLEVPDFIEQAWSMGFTHDRLNDGLSPRLFNVLDDSNCEMLGIELNPSLPAGPMIQVLE